MGVCMMEGSPGLPSLSFWSFMQRRLPMSLRNDQSPEVIALDAIPEQHRRGQEVSLLDEAALKAYATTLGAGTPVAVVRLSAREPWLDGLAALYCFHASRWDTPADVVYCYPNQAPAGSWDGTV